MTIALTLPRLVFGLGSVAALADELAALRVARPLLLADRGIERVGLVDRVQGLATFAAVFVEVPENPTLAGAEAAMTAAREGSCDGVVALGGGSVLDTAKLVAAALGSDAAPADLLGKPDAITGVAPLIAVPTTVGTGSESSPVAALHAVPGGPAIATRAPSLVPRVAICDAELARTLPPRLIAATAIDALSHCLEGYFANPPHPLIDPLALDGIARVVRDAAAAMVPEGDDARQSLMAAAFAGGLAIHKGLGPAHAIALACGDQELHHGTLVGIALPRTAALLAREVPDKGAAVARALGAGDAGGIEDALDALLRALDLPDTLGRAGYRHGDVDALVDAMVASHFNRTSPYAPSRADYAGLLARIA